MWSNPPLCPDWPSRAAVYPTWQSPWWSQQRAPLPRSLEQTGLSWASASLCSCWTKQRTKCRNNKHLQSLGETYFLTRTETHRLRTLLSWLSALNALISNSTAHCYRGREKRRHHAAMCSLHQYRFVSSVRTLPCRHHGALAGEPLSKAGCQETEKTQRQSVSSQ